MPEQFKEEHYVFAQSSDCLQSIYKLDKYITTTGNVHYFKDYYYYVDKKKLYKCSNNKIREIPMKNSYFIIKNIEGKQCCVSWLKLDLQFLQRRN